MCDLKKIKIYLLLYRLGSIDTIQKSLHIPIVQMQISVDGQGCWGKYKLGDVIVNLFFSKFSIW